MLQKTDAPIYMSCSCIDAEVSFDKKSGSTLMFIDDDSV